jgi:penicillin-binding protein 1C
VIAHVGSPGYLDDGRFGAVDMTEAVRSPGSTLKPLIYGLAFEAGLAHPETLIEDQPARFGLYVPKNFDQGWHGTITIRTALAQSLNIPAVKVLEALGPAKLHGRLQQVGITPVLPKGTEPSLAIALGGLGLKLSDLAALYAGLARGGEPIALSYRRGAPEAKAPVGGTRLLSPIAACATRRHLPTPGVGKSPIRREPPMASAMPGRSATTGAIPSPSGWAGPTVRRHPGWQAALRLRRSCSMHSRA